MPYLKPLTSLNHRVFNPFGALISYAAIAVSRRMLLGVILLGCTTSPVKDQEASFYQDLDANSDDKTDSEAETPTLLSEDASTAAPQKIEPIERPDDASAGADADGSDQTTQKMDGSMNTDVLDDVSVDASVDASGLPNSDTGALDDPSVDAGGLPDVDTDTEIPSKYDDLEMWASGSLLSPADGDSTDEHGYFFHRSNGKWTAIQASSAGNESNAIKALSFSGSQTGLASTDDSWFEYDGTVWRPGQPFSMGSISDVMVLPDSHWIMASGVYRRNGDRWVQTDTSALDPWLNEAFFFSAAGVPWMVMTGFTSAIWPFTPADHSQLAWFDKAAEQWNLSYDSNAKILDADASGDGWAAAVGKCSTSASEQDSCLFLYDGHRWQEVAIELPRPLTFPTDIFGIATPAKGIVFLIGRGNVGGSRGPGGYRGIVLRYQDQVFSLLDNSMLNMLYLVDIYALNSTTFWLIGSDLGFASSKGRIIRYEEDTWTFEELPSSPVFSGTWKLSRICSGADIEE